MINLKNFFEQARAGTLTGIRCRRCGQLSVPPQDSCSVCLGRAWEPVALSGHGTVTSFTVIGPTPAHPDAAPYAVAMVTLSEGVSLLGRIVDIPLETLVVGTAVRFRPLVARDQTTIGFGPA